MPNVCPQPTPVPRHTKSCGYISRRNPCRTVKMEQCYGRKLLTSERKERVRNERVHIPNSRHGVAIHVAPVWSGKQAIRSSSEHVRFPDTEGAEEAVGAGGHHAESAGKGITQRRGGRRVWGRPSGPLILRREAGQRKLVFQARCRQARVSFHQHRRRCFAGSPPQKSEPGPRPVRQVHRGPRLRPPAIPATPRDAVPAALRDAFPALSAAPRGCFPCLPRGSA